MERPDEPKLFSVAEVRKRGNNGLRRMAFLFVVVEVNCGFMSLGMTRTKI